MIVYDELGPALTSAQVKQLTDRINMASAAKGLAATVSFPPRRWFALDE